MYQRWLKERVLSSLADTPAVFLRGARQTGKSTLVRNLGESHQREYITLDDLTTLAAAKSDPSGFISRLPGRVTIDEIQRAPDLFPAIKQSVDHDRKPGRFLLTGSANIMVLPRLSESLAGRMAIHTLWPLAQGELEGEKENFIRHAFEDRLKHSNAVHMTNLMNRIIQGGYPEICQRKEQDRRWEWFNNYVQTVLYREIRDMADISGLDELPRILKLIASRTASLLNYGGLSNDLGMSASTLKRYLLLLEAAFLVVRIPAWSSNRGSRLIKTEKIILADTGLLTYLLGQNSEGLEADPTLAGHILENFAAMELLKQIACQKEPYQLFHFRTPAGQEVDLILEDQTGEIVGMEVKLSSKVEAADFKGLKALADAAGKRFIRGEVLYTGRQWIPFDKNLAARPIWSLWRPTILG